jgi:cytochrome P450
VPGDDVLSGLVRAPGRGATPLAEADLVAFVVQLLVNGLETQTHALGNAVLTVLRHELFATGTADWAAVFEECLRLAGPARVLSRRMRGPAEIAGHQFGAGDTVVILTGATNRDPARYPDPDRFLPDRYAPGGAAAPHLGLGHGPHHCLGAPLARLQGELVLDRLARHPGGVRLAVPEADLRWIPGLPFLGLRELPVTAAVEAARR